MKEWHTPELLCYGSFDAVTQQDKEITEPSDGFTFQGLSINDKPPT